MKSSLWLIPQMLLLFTPMITLRADSPDLEFHGKMWSAAERTVICEGWQNDKRVFAARPHALTREHNNESLEFTVGTDEFFVGYIFDSSAIEIGSKNSSTKVITYGAASDADIVVYGMKTPDGRKIRIACVGQL